MTALVATGLAMAGRLEPTDLVSDAGMMLALIGPNGGGKTSLLRALARVEDAAGQVTILGEDLDLVGEARRRRLLAFVPASRDVGWPIAVRDVIALGLAARDENRIAELIDLLELGGLADRPIGHLSTGERARVLIARALAATPRVLLLDEPYSNLEPYWVLRLGEILRAVADAGAIVLIALHDLAQLPAFDRALLVANRRIESDASPSAIVASAIFEDLFRVRPVDGGWALRSEAGRRSSR